MAQERRVLLRLGGCPLHHPIVSRCFWPSCRFDFDSVRGVAPRMVDWVFPTRLSRGNKLLSRIEILCGRVSREDVRVSRD